MGRRLEEMVDDPWTEGKPGDSVTQEDMIEDLLTKEEAGKVNGKEKKAAIQKKVCKRKIKKAPPKQEPDDKDHTTEDKREEGQAAKPTTEKRKNKTRKAKTAAADFISGVAQDQDFERSTDGLIEHLTKQDRLAKLSRRMGAGKANVKVEMDGDSLMDVAKQMNEKED